MLAYTAETQATLAGISETEFDATMAEFNTESLDEQRAREIFERLAADSKLAASGPRENGIDV